MIFLEVFSSSVRISDKNKAAITAFNYVVTEFSNNF
jgi:hypothetical protein